LAKEKTFLEAVVVPINKSKQSAPTDSTNTKSISFRIHPDEKNRFDHLKTKMGVNSSEMFRLLMETMDQATVEDSKDEVVHTECAHVEGSSDVDHEECAHVEGSSDVDRKECAHENKSNIWVHSTKVFFSNPIYLAGSLFVFALAGLLIHLQATAYIKEGFESWFGYTLAIFGEVSLVVFAACQFKEAIPKWILRFCVVGFFGYILGLMAFDVANDGIKEFKAVRSTDVAQIKLNRKLDKLEASRDSMWDRGLYTRAKETIIPEIALVREEIKVNKSQPAIQNSESLVIAKAVGLTFLRLLLMLGNVVLAHSLVKRFLTAARERHRATVAV
jgi:hypothetical protein